MGDNDNNTYRQPGVPAPGFATAQEAASYLHLSRAMIHRLINTGKMPATRYGRAVRVPWVWLRAQAEAVVFIAEGEIGEESEERVPENIEPDLTAGLRAGEAALAFVARAGARQVAPCPTCFPGLPEGATTVVVVPECNDTPEFHAALKVLRLDRAPIVYRTDPLVYLPARCAHVPEAQP